MILFGGDRLPGVPSDDYVVPVESTASIRANVRELCPRLHGFTGEGAQTLGEEDHHAGEWAGLMPFSRDGRPIVGSLASLGLPNCWLACGFGPAGIMEGPYAAKLLAGRVAGALQGGRDAVAREVEADQVSMQSLDPSRPGCCCRAVC